MKNSLLKRGINLLLEQRGLVIAPIAEGLKSSSLGYISAKETVAAAENAGLSICDYVEKQWGTLGDTQSAIEQLASCGVFGATNPNVVEIGAGTGRYLEKVLKRCEPVKYEVYETATDWADWLQKEYPIVCHEADGMTLRQTPAMSADLVFAHGVFVYLPFLASYRYWKEIWRIAKENGFVAFDIFSEDVLDEPTVEKWLTSEKNYPVFLSKPYVVAAFGNHGFSLVHSFKKRFGKGCSEYVVFIRNSPAISNERP